MVEQWLKIVKVKGGSVNELKPSFHNNPESSDASSFTSESIDNPPPLSTVDPGALSEPIATTSQTILSSTSSFVIGNVDSPSSLDDNICIKESNSNETETNLNGWDSKMGQSLVYKLTCRDGKQVFAKVYPDDKAKSPIQDEPVVNNVSNSVEIVHNDITDVSQEQTIPTTKSPNDSPNSNSTKSKSKSEKTEILEGKVLVKDMQKKLSVIKDKDKDKKSISSNSSTSSNSSNSNKSSDSIKEKSKDKDRRKDRSKLVRERNINIKNKKLSIQEKRKEREREREEKAAAQAEKDKALLAKFIPPAISKLGKIPRKVPSIDKEEDKDKKVDKKIGGPPTPEPLLSKKKASISIEVRKHDGIQGVRPKTVKTFNSKFRSTGLEEEVKPPPVKTAVAKSSTIKPIITPPLPPPAPPPPPPIPTTTRKITSPARDTPPEKKIKTALLESKDDELKKHEKPGSIKYIPAKPKRKWNLHKYIVFVFIKFLIN